MTTDTDLEINSIKDTEQKLFNFTGPGKAAVTHEQSELDYAQVDLSTTIAISDFDVRTVAIGGGIIGFKLSMLGLLLLSI